jgi:hypothetical protein
MGEKADSDGARVENLVLRFEHYITPKSQAGREPIERDDNRYTNSTNQHKSGAEKLFISPRFPKAKAN